MNKGFQEKLGQYAPEVPESAWDAIEARLNEEASFVSRLQTFETPPPPQVWSRLISKLPRSERVKPFWKKALPYALAASLLAFVVLAGNLLNSSPSNTAISNPQNNSVSSGNVPMELPSKSERVAEIIPQEEQVYNTAQSGSGSAYKASGVRYEDIPGMAYSSLSFSDIPEFIPEKAESKPSITSDDADKYMVHTDEKGNPVRVPKKIFDLVDCVKADQVCKDRIESLQQKIALSSVTTEFTGLIDLVKNLKENQ